MEFKNYILFFLIFSFSNIVSSGPPYNPQQLRSSRSNKNISWYDDYLLAKNICLQNNIIYYPLITTDHKEQIKIPAQNCAAGIEFTPSQGPLRNQHIQLLFINESDENSNTKKLTICRKILGGRTAHWLLIERLELSDSKEINFILYPDASIKIASEILFLGAII